MNVPSHAKTAIDLDALEHKVNEMLDGVLFIGCPLSRDESNALIGELRAARKVVDRARIRRNIHGKSNIRLIYEIDQAVEAFDNRD